MTLKHQLSDSEIKDTFQKLGLNTDKKRLELRSFFENSSKVEGNVFYFKSNADGREEKMENK